MARSVNPASELTTHPNLEGTPSKMIKLKRGSRSRSGVTKSLLFLGGAILVAYHGKLASQLSWQTRPTIADRDEEAMLVSILRGDQLGKSISYEGDTVQKHRAKTLALLYPPGLLGGYRNQVLRFIAFCVYAKRQNMSQILLPSLLWSTQLDGIGTHVEWFPIPFDMLFDVRHWNKFSPMQLPRLVNATDMEEKELDCWLEASDLEDLEQLRKEAPLTGNDASVNASRNTHFYLYQRTSGSELNLSTVDAIAINHLQREALLRGVIRPLINVTIPLATKQSKVNYRKVDYSELTQSCSNPYVYGGGTRAGKLWNDYISFQSATGKRRTGSSTNQSTSSFVPFDTDVWVYRALQPAAQWREVATACVNQHAATGRYIALHARVELEIMGHTCGQHMEKNLTRILQRVFRLHREVLSATDESTPLLNLSGLFIAVSRAGMADRRSSSYEKFKVYAEENIRILDRLTDPSVQRKVRDRDGLPVFECGERVLQEYYASHPDVPDHGALLQSVINFYVAVSADVFVGVEGSSYSTDVLTTRFWLGKGEGNFRYTETGIDRVENGGLPRPHSNCKKRKT